ncbi:DUF4199 domain-containing protein [Roseivirga sp.]|uniref:DUF4199 domain-containing protein n=1 Tax=Roseivirga sp. TaxID=1964215 RepID=UPI003B522EBE
MKKLIIKFGLIGAVLMVGLGFVSVSLVGSGPDGYSTGEIIGYTSILVAMSLIVVAQINYRKEQEGVLSFGEAFKIGLGISSIGGLAFGLYNAIYVLWIDPDFMRNYFAYSEQIAVTDPGFEARFRAYMDEHGIFATTFGQSLLMFLTVFLIGFVITIVGGLILHRKGTLKTA